MRRLAILGASGHGKVIADIAVCFGWEDIFFFDDAWPQKKNLGPWQVIGDSSMLLASLTRYQGCIVAIGDNVIRYEKQKILISAGGKMATLVHPRAVVSSHAMLGVGSVVMAGAILNPFAQIGDACIINTGAIIEHDCQLEDAIHISPQVALAGGVSVGFASWVGIGASVKQLVNIGAHVVVGAGSVVLTDIVDDSTVVGVPAKPIL